MFLGGITYRVRQPKLPFPPLWLCCLAYSYFRISKSSRNARWQRLQVYLEVDQRYVKGERDPENHT